MDGSSSSSVEDNVVIDWNTEDELELENCTASPPSSSLVLFGGGEATAVSGESTRPSSSNSKALDQFLGMGFSKQMVEKAIEEHGENNTEAILETLLTYPVSLDLSSDVNVIFNIDNLSW